MKTSVLLAEDHAMVREGLRVLIDAENDMRVVGEAGNGHEALKACRQLLPDVVLMDIVMPEQDGLEATRRIREQMPLVKIVILSSYTDAEYVQRATEAGAVGYLIKQTTAIDVILAIREAKKGNAFFSPMISQRLIKNYRTAFLRGQPQVKDGDLLTDRESEVLHHIAEGGSSKQIALDLGVTIKTVDKHRQSIMKKLDIHEVAGLTRYAVNRGLIEVERETMGAERFAQESLVCDSSLAGDQRV